MNEVYKLTFEHYFIDNDGKKIRLDEPVSTQCVLRMRDNVSIPMVLNSMIDKMRNYLLEVEKQNETDR